MEYENFIRTKADDAHFKGFSANDLPDCLFGHQKLMAEFACDAGGAACFYDTGLGKTIIELSVMDQFRRKSNKPSLLLAPIAVGKQTSSEAKKFGIDDVNYIKEPSEVKKNAINITNYERLHKFNLDEFGGVALDESSILKSFTGATTRKLIKAFEKHPYKFAATATPAPNDHMELGQHSEFLSVMRSSEMLMRWFIADQQNMGKYRLKGHAVDPFWQWVASWAKAATRPSDVGDFSDEGYDLEPFDMVKHIVRADITNDVQDGMLFRVADTSATAIHKEKRRTIRDRAAVIAELVKKDSGNPHIIWCDTDYEADVLNEMIPESVEVRGSHKEADKEDRLIGFTEGKYRVLTSKPKLAGFGLNWQHCNNVHFVGISYSYEAFYQAIRRCWRFGQKNKVTVNACLSDTEMNIWNTIVRKRDDHKVMSERMVNAMKKEQLKANVKVAYNRNKANMPSFI